MSSLLIADDHSLFRRGLEVALTSAGHEVVLSVADGEAALEALLESDAEVVMLDLRMPIRDGLSTLREMRARNDRRPVVILAAEIDDESLVGLMECGADAILLKNGSEFRLFDAIRAVTEGARFFDADIVDRAFKLSRPPWDEKLNEREIAIAREVAAGLRNREIGDKLGMTINTVKIYLHGIFAKLGVQSRSELAGIIIKAERLTH